MNPKEEAFICRLEDKNQNSEVINLQLRHIHQEKTKKNRSQKTQKI
jgi:hypothetical protein